MIVNQILENQKDKEKNNYNFHFPTIEEFEKAMKDENFRKEYLKKFIEDNDKEFPTN